MRLIAIPPYQNPTVQLEWVLRELMANLKKGQLDGVEVDIDEGYFIDSATETRDEEVLANISVGIIKKVKEYSEMGKYDGIILTGALDPGFVAARVVSKIPITGAVHSAIHVASLIGERFSIIHTVAPSSLIVKHLVERYGLSHKLASVRFCRHSGPYLFKLISKYKKEERVKAPEVKKVIGDITTQCIAAIEKDRADSLILGCEQMQTFEYEVRQKLDEAGYHEIPMICPFPAGLEMVKAMVNMNLVQTARAYPSAGLKAQPEYW